MTNKVWGEPYRLKFERVVLPVCPKCNKTFYPRKNGYPKWCPNCKARLKPPIEKSQEQLGHEFIVQWLRGLR